MKKLYIPILGTFLSVAQISLAGIPIQENNTCPVGGETFKTTGTASCSSMGHTLSMKRISSCDFVTPLPQCPKNKLPMYKDFTDTDISELAKIMETRAYKDASIGSPFQLAAIVEQKLSSFDRETLFFILQQGIWYTPEQVMDNPEYMTSYHRTADNVFELLEDGDRPFWRGAQAFVHMQQGNLNAARNAVEMMKQENNNGNDYLTEYIDALTYCLDKLDDKELCSASSSLRSHMQKDKKNSRN